MVSDVFSSASTTQDDKVKKELIQIVASRLIYAGLNSLVPLGKLPPYEDVSKEEDFAGGTIGAYMLDLQKLFEDYFKFLDLVPSLNLGALELDVIKGLNSDIGQQVEDLLSKKRVAVSDIQEKFKGAMQRIEEIDADADAEEEGAEDDEEISIPPSIPLPATCRPDHIQTVAHDLKFINQCYYHSWLKSEQEGDQNEPGTLAGFNAAYLWVQQAIHDLYGMQPEQLYPVTVQPVAQPTPAPFAGTFTPPGVSCRLQ